MSEVRDLEVLYSPSYWSKRYKREELLEKHVEFLEKHSKLVKERIPCELNVSYGPGQKEKYDIYGTDLPDDTSLLIHIHGGYYQEKQMTHTNNGLISNSLYQNRIKTILLGYELSPERTIGEILEHIQIGLRECLNYAKRMKTRSIFLSGHSVGAHSIASILTDFKRSIPQKDGDLIKGVFLMCGVYDLQPVTKMSANDVWNISEKTAREELSPLFDDLEYGNVVVHVIAAENDSPAFIEQSRDFFRKLFNDGVECYFRVVPTVDHFDIVENLYDPDFELSKMIAGIVNKKL